MHRPGDGDGRGNAAREGAQREVRHQHRPQAGLLYLSALGGCCGGEFQDGARICGLPYAAHHPALAGALPCWIPQLSLTRFEYPGNIDNRGLSGLKVPRQQPWETVASQGGHVLARSSVPSLFLCGANPKFSDPASTTAC